MSVWYPYGHVIFAVVCRTFKRVAKVITTICAPIQKTRPCHSWCLHTNIAHQKSYPTITKCHEDRWIDKLVIDCEPDCLSFPSFSSRLGVFSKKHPVLVLVTGTTRATSCTILQIKGGILPKILEEGWGHFFVLFCFLTSILYIYIYFTLLFLERVFVGSFCVFGPARLFLPWRKALKMLWVPGWRRAVLEQFWPRLTMIEVML